MGYRAGSLSVEMLGIDKTLSTTLDNIILRIEKLERTVGRFGRTGSRNAQKNGGAFGFLKVAKWTAVFSIARRFGRVLGNIVQSGADYTETLNLWETAMGSNLNVATEFVNKMNEAYGISEKTLMNAQAIFKNMLGSLGQISDTMAYTLSEGITQMALDYASLYNLTFEKAFTKFQAVLAGQVRPIRSVSGYDITENTLYQLYQSLGGTKTMRQLTRTEKQLLSILAVFQQMSASGAVGDLDDTMESFANQSRVMAESWQQVKTYAGVVLTHLIEESGILTYVNAVLIFIGDTLKAVAESMGAIKHFADPFESTTESALGASDAIDEVQGKLLDFDKFRSLSGSEENALGLDEKLLNALSGYDTILANASMEARDLAESWKVMSGLFDENGVFNPERWEEIVDSIEAFGHALLAIIASKALSGIANGIKSITLASQGLSNILLTGVIFAIIQAIDAFRDGDTVAGIIATTIGVVLVGAFVALKVAQHKSLLAQKAHDSQVAVGALTQANYNATLDRYMILLLRANGVSMKKIQWARQDIVTTKQQAIEQENLNRALLKNEKRLNSQAKSLQTLSLAFTGFTMLTSGIMTFVGGLEQMSDSAKTLIPTLSVLVGVITALAVGLHFAKGQWGKALAIGALVTGAGLTVGTTIATMGVNKYAEGGLPDKGTMFIAGEAGAEIVYNTPSGQSGVANVQQIEQAMYSALIRYGRTQGGNGQPIEVYLDGERVYQNTTAHAKKHGQVWGKA